MPMAETIRLPARPLRREDAKTLVLAALGGALEFYDFVIFVFLATAIGQLFFPPDTADWLRTRPGRTSIVAWRDGSVEQST